MSTAGSLVNVIVPKYVTITSNTQLAKIRPAPAVSPATRTTHVGILSPAYNSGYASSTNSCADEIITAPKGKKRRLDHLTWEEKVQRKKLKNRVAAQTSRDRKKARMEEMEFEIKELKQKAEILQNKCESLKVINDTLTTQNDKLNAQVETLNHKLNQVLKKQEINQNVNKVEHDIVGVDKKFATESCAGCASILNGSAVSNIDSLPQGLNMDTQSKQHSMLQQLNKTKTLASLWKIVALCLLYKTCSLTSVTKTSMHKKSKNWRNLYSQISQQTWKQAMENAIKMLPKMQAARSDCLDQWWGPQQNAWNPTEVELKA